ncbi:MAG: hypothetical protein IJ409_11755 [Lachnospiraceae bacterium]|nr:hypothetical protein [Lachnospiraceae bacterium]
MAWCPKCKCEYVEGIKVCADCGCDLVQSLEEANGVQGEQELTVEMAVAMLQTMQRQGIPLPKEMVDPEVQSIAQDKEPVKHYKPYINNEERAEDNKMSAYTLLLVGSVGLAFIVLMFLEVLPIRMTVSGKYMTCGVMGVMFILFIVMGIVSLRNSKILKKKAKKENNLTREIKKWCLDIFKKEEVDERLQIGGLPEELKYFQRFDYMKNTIKNQFMNLDEAYLDRLIEEIYPEIFERDES